MSARPAPGSDRTIDFQPTTPLTGALVRGVDLSEELSGKVIADLRQAPVDHQVAY